MFSIAEDSLASVKVRAFRIIVLFGIRRLSPLSSETFAEVSRSNLFVESLIFNL